MSMVRLAITEVSKNVHLFITLFSFFYVDMVKTEPLENEIHNRNEHAEDLKGNIVICSQCKKELPQDHEAIKHHMRTEHMTVKRKRISSVSENSPRNDQSFESADEDDGNENR